MDGDYTYTCSCNGGYKGTNCAGKLQMSEQSLRILRRMGCLVLSGKVPEQKNTNLNFYSQTSLYSRSMGGDCLIQLNSFDSVHTQVLLKKIIKNSKEIFFERSHDLLTLIVPAKNFQASVKCRKAQKCLYLTLSIQCHMQLKLLMSLTAV